MTETVNAENSNHIDQNELANMAKLFLNTNVDPEPTKVDVITPKTTDTTKVEDDDEEDEEDIEMESDKTPKTDETDIIKAKRDAKNRYLPQIGKLAKERDELKAKLAEASKVKEGSDQPTTLTPDQVEQMIELRLKDTELSSVMDKSERYFYKKNDAFKSDTEFQSYVEFYKEKYPTMSLDEVKNIYVWENLDKFTTGKESKSIDISSNVPTFQDQEKKLSDGEIKEMAMAEFLKTFKK